MVKMESKQPTSWEIMLGGSHRSNRSILVLEGLRKVQYRVRVDLLLIIRPSPLDPISYMHLQALESILLVCHHPSQFRL